MAPLLRAAGKTVYTPGLTGLADRSHLRDCNVNLTTHINDITNLLFYEDLSDVVLVGNSYAGMVITGVAARMPERIRLLVYLDAYIPENGQSEADFWPAETRAARQADAAAHGGFNLAPPPEIFGVTDPALLDWMKARATLHPYASYIEAVPLEDARSSALPGAFIRCTGNPPTTPDLFGPSAAKAKAKGWEVRDLPAGHLAMLTAPDQLAELLLELSR